MGKGTEIYKEQQKQQDLFKQDTLEENAFKTEYKNLSGADGFSGDQESQDFAKISSIPEPAVNKNDGVFRFFQKKSRT